MSRANVKLRIARFRPEATPAGLTDEQRAVHRERRARECAKVEPLIQEVFKPFNVFMYGNFVQVVPIVPDPIAPPPPPAHACDEIDCIECQNRGLHYGDWEKAKRLNEL